MRTHHMRTYGQYKRARRRTEAYAARYRRQQEQRAERVARRQQKARRQQVTALEPLRGAAAPAETSLHYVVQPGENGGAPEYFPGTSTGLADAIARAVRLSVSWPPQRVWCAEPGNAPRMIRRYQDGTARWGS
jgi:hypothetical protein